MKKDLSLTDQREVQLHSLVSQTENEPRITVFFVVCLVDQAGVVSIIVFKDCTIEEVPKETKVT